MTRRDSGPTQFQSATSASKKTHSSAKKARPDIAKISGTAAPVKRVKRTVAAAQSKKKATSSANQESHPADTLARYRKLLARQAALIKRLETYGVSDPMQLPLSSNAIVPQHKVKRLSKAEVQEIAKGVGIWTASGKLSASYKK
jgi:hypothetical protein